MLVHPQDPPFDRPPDPGRLLEPRIVELRGQRLGSRLDGREAGLEPDRTAVRPGVLDRDGQFGQVQGEVVRREGWTPGLKGVREFRDADRLVLLAEFAPRRRPQEIAGRPPSRAWR